MSEKPFIQIFSDFSRILEDIKKNVSGARDEELLEAFEVINAEIMKRAREQQQRLIQNILEILKKMKEIEEETLQQSELSEMRVGVIALYELTNKLEEELRRMIE